MLYRYYGWSKLKTTGFKVMIRWSLFRPTKLVNIIFVHFEFLNAFYWSAKYYLWFFLPFFHSKFFILFIILLFVFCVFFVLFAFCLNVFCVVACLLFVWVLISFWLFQLYCILFVDLLSCNIYSLCFFISLSITVFWVWCSASVNIYLFFDHKVYML